MSAAPGLPSLRAFFRLVPFVAGISTLLLAYDPAHSLVGVTTVVVCSSVDGHLAFPTFRLLCMGPRKYTGTGFHGDVCLPCSWAGTGGERLGHVVTAASVSGALSDLPAWARVYAPARGPV